MLTEREKRIVDWLDREAEAILTDCDGQMGYDALLKKLTIERLARALRSGEHLKRPEPSVPASEWMGKSNLGY